MSFILSVCMVKKVHIRFNSNIKILVSDNGAGKTTILNLLYYMISKQYEKLNAYDFDLVGIKHKEDTLEIKQDRFIKENKKEIYRIIEKHLPTEVLTNYFSSLKIGLN